MGLTGTGTTYTWTRSGDVVDENFWGVSVLGQTDTCGRIRRFPSGQWNLDYVSCSNVDKALCERIPPLSTVEVEAVAGRKYTRTVPPSDWPLCHGESMSRRSRVQCATWCSTEVTCVGFEFYQNTCQLVKLESPCNMTSSFVVSASRGRYFQNEAVDMDRVMGLFMTACN